MKKTIATLLLIILFALPAFGQGYINKKKPIAWTPHPHLVWLAVEQILSFKGKFIF